MWEEQHYECFSATTVRDIRKNKGLQLNKCCYRNIGVVFFDFSYKHNVSVELIALFNIWQIQEVNTQLTLYKQMYCKFMIFYSLSCSILFSKNVEK